MRRRPKGPHALYSLHDHVRDSSLSIYALKDALKDLKQKKKQQQRLNKNQSSPYSSGASSGGSLLQVSNYANLQFIPANALTIDEAIAGARFHGVFKATYASNDVCVKYFRTDALNESMLARFMSNLQRISSLSHPHIVRLFGICMKKDSLIVVSELCAVSLSDVLSVRPVPTLIEEHQYSIALQICHAMAYVHANSLVHGRLKVRTVLFVNEYTPSSGSVHIKIGGFGSSWAQSQRITATEVARASFLMAPEIMSGSTIDATPEADVYSCGHILKCLFSNTLMLTMPQTASLTPSSPNSPRPPRPHFAPPPPPEFQTSPAVAHILVRCVDMDTRKRPTFAELASFFEAQLRSKTTKSWKSDASTISTTSTWTSSVGTASTSTSTVSASIQADLHPSDGKHNYATV